MKKTFTMLLALLALSLSMFAGNPGVTFLLRSGQRVSFTFAEKPVVAFSEPNLSVCVRGVERVSYAYSDVQRFFVEDNVISAVDNVAAKGKSRHAIFALSTNSLEASGLAANEPFSLYATDGKLVLNAMTNAEGKAAITLTSLQQGIYVVRTQSGISYKLFKK